MACINIKREVSDTDEECSGESQVSNTGTLEYGKEYKIVFESDVKQEVLDSIEREPSCSYGKDLRMDCNNIKREVSDTDEECPGESQFSNTECVKEYEIDIVQIDVKQEVLDSITQEPSCSYGKDVPLELEKSEDSPVVGSSLMPSLLEDSCSTLQLKETDDTQDNYKQRDSVEMEHVCQVCSYKANQKKPLRIHQLFSCCELKQISKSGSVPGTSTRQTTSESGPSTSTAQQKITTRVKSEQAIIKTNKYKNTSTVNNTKLYYCNDCSYKGNKSGLIFHIQKHTNSKPFACDQCDFKTRMPRYLKIHKSIHTLHKPFACDQCGFRTKALVYLNAHKLRHFQYKPTESCNTKYRKNSELHYKPISLFCDQCRYKTTQSCALIAHKLTHTEPKLYACDQCAYKTTLSDAFKSHNLIH